MARVDCSLFVIQVACPIEPGGSLQADLAGKLRAAPANATYFEKWIFYRAVCDRLIADARCFELGVWDYFEDQPTVAREFEGWAGSLTDSEPRTAPSTFGANPYAASSDRRYLLFTIAFLLQLRSNSDLTVRARCEKADADKWSRATFVSLLEGVAHINFASVQSDLVYLLPRDPAYALTPEDVPGAHYPYLRRLT